MTDGALSSHDRLYIGGEWVVPAGDDRIPVISPVSEEVIASVPAGTRADIDRAVTAAHEALVANPWASTTLEDRIALVERLRDLLVKHSEELAQVITEEMGCPISQSRAIQVVNPVRILEGYVEAATRYPFRSVRRSEHGQALVLREPVGVVAAVVPWNVPLSLTIQKLVPALLTGCTIVLKPSPETPLDAYVVARLLDEAGCPPGVVNIVPADRDVSEYLIGHPGVAKVTFTGSSAAGRRIAEVCGKDLRRVTLELGGKSAAVVLPDADLDLTVEALRLGSFRNNGQICTLKTRLVVPAELQDEFVDRLGDLLDSMVVGDPRDAATHIGPLVSERQRTRVEGYIATGLAEGGRLAHGGGRPDIDRGWFVEPTVFADVDPNATIAQQEIFGPVVAVIPYANEDEAITIANNSTYGLNGAVFTTDVERGVEVARRLETGTVELNGNSAGFQAPMGGVKYSGLGREFGPEGLDPFVELKSIGIPPAIADALA
ncbi:betaine-aldehyde dehydrogenase [Kribbella sp. VKM Ac-2527]|uniref:Betaine-aldehyde dehydrogenase n=1 Tax=Kribbella caucasensis TaxID=2512215 RepID=A0A4R6KJU5_9ACTN|nr:aldehyde dehydrogenase [Kribbella sp. VKM Ac-2527]TDO51588.1 betaine-aldehyde dehydrogenase [Kribbella sp. VKM Ac-2527]